MRGAGNREIGGRREERKDNRVERGEFDSLGKIKQKRGRGGGRMKRSSSKRNEKALRVRAKEKLMRQGKE